MIMGLPKIYNTYFVALIATLGGMLFGFDISSMSAIIGTDQYNDFFHNPEGIYQGVIGAALAAGSIIGSFIAGPTSDAVGRRNAIGFGMAVSTRTAWTDPNSLPVVVGWYSRADSSQWLRYARCRSSSQWCLRWHYLISGSSLSG